MCQVRVGIRLLGAWCVLPLVVWCAAAAGADFRSAWPKDIERVWVGPAYWANPLQDWRISSGRLECVVSGGNRNVHLLTHPLGDGAGDLRMSVRLGRLDKGASRLGPGWVGFRIGAKGQLNEYRDSALKGVGLHAGVTTAGVLFVGEPGRAKLHPTSAGPVGLKDLELRLAAAPVGGQYTITLAAHDPRTGEQLGTVRREQLPAKKLVGNLALVCAAERPSDGGAKRRRRPTTARFGHVRFWFSDWTISGSKVEHHGNRTFGPILFAQHTLSRGVMKMTAQMPPIGKKDTQTVRLEVRQANGRWKTIGEQPIHKLARTATFRIENWDATRDVPYRLAYALVGADGKRQDYFWTGTVRREPTHKDTLVVAGFTGNKDTGFPNTNTVRNVRYHNPDVMVFTGDQIYEDVAGYGIQQHPVETACLDYLRKWYLLGWSFGDLMRDRLTICLPDDHDVYQGNIWGAGGRKISRKEHDRGGYVMPAEWVNMVQRTQASHLPDPYDPAPVEQGIGVYFAEMNYARISFAIIEDRKFKSGPKGLCPPTGGRADHVTDASFDPKTADVPGATLLGDRQLKFLRNWAADWRGADMKIAVSQTLFANVASLHGAEKRRLVADYDSNGWPQTGRNKALHELRRGFAFHLGGDQHLPSIVHHGIDTFEDAGFSFCVPSTAAGYPRAWLPLVPGKNRKPGAPEYTGQFLDGFGNHVTVHAVANPKEKLRKPPLAMLHDKSSGYGLVRLNKKTGKITMECWRLLVDPSNPSADDQFEGWPMTIDMQDNYARKAAGYLPTVTVRGMTHPVIQVIDESDGEIVYTLRIRGTSYQPKVFKAGSYTVRAGDPDTGRIKTVTGLRSTASREKPSITLTF